MSANIGPDDHDITFADDRYVKICCDYCCEGTWDRKNCSVDHDEFPITDDLKARLMGWQEIYNRYHVIEFDAIDLDEKPDLDWERFSAIGLEIAKEVKRQLPDWTVVYIDVYKARTQSPSSRLGRGVYEYEVL